MVPMDAVDMTSPRVPALMYATMQGYVEIIEYLLDQGADVEQADTFGFTPLHACAFKGEADACAVLLEHAGGADGAAANFFHEDGNAPMHRACFGDESNPASKDTLKVFLDAGMNPHLLTKEDTIGRGGTAGMTCADVTGDPDVKALWEVYAENTKAPDVPEEKPKGKGGRKKGKKGGGKAKGEATMDDILAAHPDL